MIREEVQAEVGTQRVLMRPRFGGQWDAYDWSDADRTDYRAQLWQDDTDHLHDAIDAWHRLRRCAGLPDRPYKDVLLGTCCSWPLYDIGELKPEHALKGSPTLAPH